MSQIEEFNDYHFKMNEKILSSDNKVLKRLFNPDYAIRFVMRL